MIGKGRLSWHEGSLLDRILELEFRLAILWLLRVGEVEIGGWHAVLRLKGRHRCGRWYLPASWLLLLLLLVGSDADSVHTLGQERGAPLLGVLLLAKAERACAL